jgi:hypothetical protein
MLGHDGAADAKFPHSSQHITGRQHGVKEKRPGFGRPDVPKVLHHLPPGAIFGLERGKWPEKAVERYPDANCPKIAEDCEDCEGCTSPAARNLRDGEGKGSRQRRGQPVAGHGADEVATLVGAGTGGPQGGGPGAEVGDEGFGGSAAGLERSAAREVQRKGRAGPFSGPFPGPFPG